MSDRTYREVQILQLRKADLIHNFGSGMKCSFPEHREGLA